MLNSLILAVVLAPVFVGIASSPKTTKITRKIFSTIGLVLASYGIFSLAILLSLVKVTPLATNWWDVLAMKDTLSVFIGYIIGLILVVFFGIITLVSAKKMSVSNEAPTQ